jgi:isoleucyl-tRNA synthetase
MQTTKITYPQYKTLDFASIEAQVAQFWNEEHIFEKSITLREGKPSFTFYEGPPSANGMPGVHHVMARTLKDLVCRYQTLKGKQVRRKGGWDTHGLPIELQVEKTLGITKKDIGEKISIAEYNKACRQDVMKFKHVWDDLTVKMGYWLDLDHPYITFENNYIESVWHLLKRLYDKGLIYKGYTIQPYSPAAGTGLSSHELNLPGCYKAVKDTSVVAQFKIIGKEDEYFLAWTTTPWTLPANAALAVGKEITYVKVDTFNPYTHLRVKVILAKERLSAYFSEGADQLPMEDYKAGDKKIPYRLLSEHKGKDLEGIRYEQLLPYIQPEGDAFRVIIGDFVSTEDGTGIVHIAPTFGSDDLRVARLNNIPAIIIPGNDGEELPIVDRQGKFVDQITDFAGRYVKDYTNDPNYQSVDVDIAIKLKTENKAFKVEKYEHNYPHCWRTDKPVLYYPLDSWFIKSSAYRERMAELNKTINWKPESTGSGRFGNWLENLTDWNLSRSRYWGIPLPIWVNEDKSEIKCMGSIAELSAEIDLAVTKGLMSRNPTQDADFDLHRPYCDEIILADSQGRPMYREPDLIDVWFDSGAMPYAQWHYPFENEEIFKDSFPADFIAEGVDQTRGWFFTLHAIAVMLFDSVAFKNVIANGLVLDKNGNKMSKRLGNAVDPFETIATYGADPTRWYMIENAPPWDNLKFNLDGITETQRRFFGTLYNTYSFFALYANIDGFMLDEQNIIPVSDRPELDRWIISKLHSLIRQADQAYAQYEPTRAARLIQEFVVEDLSNWYVRLARRRFWKGELTNDKKSAYETLFECLTVVAQLMSPIAPYFSDWLYKNMTDGMREQAIANQSKLAPVSIHLTDFAVSEEAVIDLELEERMTIAQQICSLVRSIRRKVNIKVRQPLSRLLIPVLDSKIKERIEAVGDLIKSEINVKELEFITDDSGVLIKKIKPQFKNLGKKAGAKMPLLTQAVAGMNQDDIRAIEKNGTFRFDLGGEPFDFLLEDAEIMTEDLPGWSVASEGKLTVALDITITEELRQEGIAREFVNRIQNLRKDLDFDVTDHIALQIEDHPDFTPALTAYRDYLCTETLADIFDIVPALSEAVVVDIDGVEGKMVVERM